MKQSILLMTAAFGVLVGNAFSQSLIALSNNGSTLVTVVGGGAVAVTSTSGTKVQLFYQPDPNGSTAPAPINPYTGALGNWEAISTLADIAPLAWPLQCRERDHGQRRCSCWQCVV